MSSGKSPVGRRPKTLAWSLLCSLVALQSALSVQAALQPGFCGDCQTFSNAIGVCGGTFTELDITTGTEYVLQQQFAKCICTSAMQSVLWKCASCESLGGKPSKSPPPNKYQRTCMMTFGITAAEYNAPYTGVVAPDTQGLVGDGSPAPPVLPNNPTPSPQPTQPGTGGGGNGNGGNGNGNGNGNGGSGGSGGQPSTDIPVPSSNADTATSESTSTGPSSTVIGAAAGVVGIAMFAGMFAVVAMKRRRRRHTPLDLDSLPGHGLDDKWDKPHLPPSPALHPAPPAMPPAHVSGAVRGGQGYDGGQGYSEGSVVGGYDNYDNYDQYRGGPGAYDQYGGQYPNQYGDQQYGGYHGQDGYDYGYEGYDNGPNAKPTAFHTGDAGRGAQAQGQGQGQYL